MLKASDLTKAHDGAPLFEGLSFVLRDGERAGLVGHNGVGKSTLLRLLAGADRPDRGAVATGAGDRIGRLAQEPRPPGRRWARSSARGPARRGLPARSCASSRHGWPRATHRRGRSRPTAMRRSASTPSTAGAWTPRSTRRAAPWASTISTTQRRCTGSRAASRRGRCWRERCSRGRPSCFSTSRPTTSTATAWPGSKPGCAPTTGPRSSSPTTAPSSTRSSIASSSSGPTVHSPATTGDTATIAPSASAGGRGSPWPPRPRRSDDEGCTRTSRPRGASRGTPRTPPAAWAPTSSSATPRRWRARPRPASAACIASSRARRR